MSKGFTILELIIVMFFISILGVIVAQGISSSLRDNRRLEVETQVQRESAMALERIAKVLRSTTQIIAVDPNSITIRGYPTVDETIPSEIRYFIDDQRLRLSVTPPSGVAPNFIYNPSSAVETTLIGRVVNDNNNHLFEYYNEANVRLTGTINIADIRSIEILPRVIDRNNILRTPFSTSTKVMFRNFKTNL